MGMRLYLSIVLVAAMAALGESLPDQPIGMDIDNHGIHSPPILADNAVPSGSVLETRVQGARLILDWTSASGAPARFRILKPDGRAIAMRKGKRSVQGWIASLRIAGWPGGIYLLEAESGTNRMAAKILLP